MCEGAPITLMMFGEHQQCSSNVWPACVSDRAKSHFASSQTITACEAKPIRKQIFKASAACPTPAHLDFEAIVKTKSAQGNRIEPKGFGRKANHMRLGVPQQHGTLNFYPHT